VCDDFLVLRFHGGLLVGWPSAAASVGHYAPNA
jgi:hypothetical protein